MTVSMLAPSSDGCHFTRSTFSLLFNESGLVIGIENVLLFQFGLTQLSTIGAVVPQHSTFMDGHGQLG